MTFSNRELIRRFVEGKTSGKACNMEIREADGKTLLVGYGWARYAERQKDSGEITLFDGWYGYSSTTSRHVNMVRSHADYESGMKPRV